MANVIVDGKALLICIAQPAASREGAEGDEDPDELPNYHRS
jgi:hypothetical protein